MLALGACRSSSMLRLPQRRVSSPSSGAPHPVTVAMGDGIGPEIARATLEVLKAAKANIKPEFIDIGEKVYLSGVSSGITAEGWESMRRTKVFLKAPITTPLGGGVKSLNVSVRKTLGLYANVRPCMAYTPYVHSHTPGMDLVIIRENEEDLYAGIEHRQTSEVLQCLKLITVPGTEKIMRYAFDYAIKFGRKKVTCMSKPNIMKLCDGTFKSIFERVAKDYPSIETDHWIIDIGAAKLATKPQLFDVIVTQNLYGDIISDIAAEVSGSVGMAASANVGDIVSMFEAIHGSAPDIAGKNIANPSGLINAAVMMLVHLNERSTAALIKNAWLRTIEDGIHPADIYRQDVSEKLASCTSFAEAVIARLGQEPQEIHFRARNSPVRFESAEEPPRAPVQKSAPPPPPREPVKRLVGIDIFVDWDMDSRNPDSLAAQLKTAANVPSLTLQMISNRGVKVWPNGFPETFKVNHWRCRFYAGAGNSAEIAAEEVVRLQQQLVAQGLKVIKTENLYMFDNEPGFSLSQGQ